MPLKEGIKTFYARDRKEWRKWLGLNHQIETKLWLIIYHKKSATPSVHYDEAVEEALCFGWIDSTPSKRDAESFFLSFSPRKPKGVWSKINKKRVKNLIRDGLMQPAGLEMIQLAKKTGTWTALNSIDRIEIPGDLQKALKKNKAATSNFEAFPPSSKKIVLGWIQQAKTDTTRRKRIKETIALAAKNIRANHYWKKN